MGTNHDNVNRLLHPTAISSAESLGVLARQVVEGYMAGEHKSPYRGFAVEFAQHREYTPGDDLRHLDWKVLGRTDRHYIKQYEQETNFVAHLLVDGSESMAYASGEVSKLDYAKTLAACLAYVILNQRDSVALGILDEELRHYIPRSDNRDTLFTIMSLLASHQPAAGTQLAEILHQMAVTVQRKGIFVLISDLLDDEESLFHGIQHLRFAGHEVILFHVLDPYEIDFPFTGLVEFEGLEQIPKLMTRPQQIRETYLREFRAYRERIEEFCRQHDTHYVLANTQLDLRDVLTGYLAFRHESV